MGSQCYRGQRVQYMRRRQDAECYNGIEFEDGEVTERCSCVQEDYECDGECWYREPTTTICLNKCVGSDKDPEVEPEQCEGTWTKTRGYRLVPGNQCNPQTGVNLLPVELECS